MEAPGTILPLAYRYQPEALAEPARLEADTLYVVGGLHGNPAALQALLERADRAEWSTLPPQSRPARRRPPASPTAGPP